MFIKQLSYHQFKTALYQYVHWYTQEQNVQKPNNS